MEVKDLVRVVWCNEPVLTTAQVSAVYGCPTTRIKDNFRLAKEQFKEGVHYFKVSGAALRELKQSEGFAPLAISKMTSNLYLWTKQGVIRHCKMLNTPKAWEIFDELEKNYFNTPSSPLLAPPALPAPTRKPISEMAFAYVFDMSDDMVKIGHTGDIEDRKARVKRERGLDVRQEHHTPALPRDDARRIEKTMHKKYAQVKVKGEFFRADFEEVSEELDRLAKVEIDLYEEIIVADYQREKLLVELLNTRLDSPLKEEVFKETANLLLGRKLF